MCTLSAGIVPGFSLIMLSLGFMSFNPGSPATSADLEKWFSAARMSTYAYHASPVDLYVWNTRITKAFLEDIQHVEVLLRNRINDAVTPRYGAQWFSSTDLALSSQAREAVSKAHRRAGGPSASPDKVIAELNLDFWRFLITHRHRATIWPLVQKTLHGPPSLEKFEAEVKKIYALRNRCAHHEPLVHQDQNRQDQKIARATTALNRVAAWISPDACAWIISVSRVAEIRNQHP